MFGGNQVLHVTGTIPTVEHGGGSLLLPAEFKQLEQGAKIEGKLTIYRFNFIK